MNSPSWAVFAENNQAWLSILKDCAAAQKSIVLEQFIFVNDEFGQKLINICAERASAGVKVRFLWDAAGSFTFFGTSIVEDLKKKGIELVFWRTLVPSYFKVPNYRYWYLRNHRRTLVIDDKIGYTGSICISDAMKNWRDTNIRLTSPVVQVMSADFERMWNRAKKIRKSVPGPETSDPEFSYVTNNPLPGKHHIYHKVIKALSRSKHYVYITMPYFVPTRKLLRSIKSAAKRGVDVRIILPEKSDHYPALDLGARSYFNSLLEHGVRIFLYPNIDGSVIHAKTTLIDGTWATIGSMNFDNASLLYNYEANIITSNTVLIEEMAAHFVRDMNMSKEVNLQEWKSRFFIEKIPEHLIKLVTKFL